MILITPSKSFDNLISNGRVSDCPVSMVIEIATKIYSLVSCTTRHLSNITSEFVQNILNNVVNRQSDKRTNRQKKNPTLLKRSQGCTEMVYILAIYLTTIGHYLYHILI